MKAGLTMGYNFMHRKHPANGFVCYMIGRLVLEYCKDVDEAVRFLKELPHRSSFSYILMDRKLNHAIVEVTPRSFDVRYDKVCTNHFEILTHENRNYTKESRERLERTVSQTSQSLDKHQLLNYLMIQNSKYIANYLKVGQVRYTLQCMNRKT